MAKSPPTKARPKRGGARPQAGKARPKRESPRTQYGALPYRAADGLEVLLVTTRETGRWVIPKGWPMAGKSARAAAAREALEEAGVVGKAARDSLGAYDYMKFLKTGEGVPCRVTVFALEVVEQRAAWRERDQRDVRWFTPEAAAFLVHEPGLAEIIRRFGEEFPR